MSNIDKLKFKESIKNILNIIFQGTSETIRTTIVDPLPPANAGLVSDSNSSQLPLGSGVSFEGEWQDTLMYNNIIVGIISDKISAIDGLSVQWSSNGKSVEDSDSFTIPENTGKVFTFSPARRYIKIMYTNGAEIQTVFSLQTIMKQGGIKSSSHRIQDSILSEDDAELMMTVQKVIDPSGLFYHNVAVDNPMPVSSQFGVPTDYADQTANTEIFHIQKGVLNKYRIRTAILNEHVESSREVQDVVTSTKIVGQIFKASHDNINSIMLTMESAAGVIFDNFENYADSAALQAIWVASNNSFLAELSTVVFKDGSKAMSLPLNAVVGDNWYNSIISTDYANYTFVMDYYQIKSYDKAKLRFIIQDSAGNSKSLPLIINAESTWQNFEFLEATLEESVGNTLDTDTTDIVKIGYVLAERENGGIGYIDNLIMIPTPGSVKLKLWDMGTTLPADGVTAIDDGTQYVTLGDQGITGESSPEIIVELLGSKRLYTVKHFVAGAALEIPTNVLLVPGNYYAITINYIDTDVSIYGPPSDYGINYYNNGFSFIASDESSAITALGTNKDCMFGIFSCQNVYINTLWKSYDSQPGNKASEHIFIEDKDMKITNILIGESFVIQNFSVEFKDRLFNLPKGGKFEVYYNDDLTDDATTMSLLIGYIYKQLPTNG